MAGLTSEGFTPLQFSEIVENIETRLEQYNPGFDFTPDSPDGQLISIMSVLINQAWIELNRVYHSYNPNEAYGQGLKNLGMITGIYKGAATRSQAVVSLTGVGNTKVPKGSIMADADGNEFYTNRDAYLPADVTVLSVLSGPLPVPAGSITDIISVVNGWTGINQADDGIIGLQPETDLQYRVRRNNTVMRGSNTVEESMSAAIIDLGIPQVTVINNDTEVVFSDGTPAHNIHVLIGEYSGISDDEIGQAIFDNKGLGVPTNGSTTVVIDDSFGNPHDVSFTPATEVPIFFNIEVTYHSVETAGADEQIKKNLCEFINTLTTGQDVIWSGLFCLITPVAQAEVNLLEIGTSAGAVAAANVVISDTEYASCDTTNIILTVL